MSESRLSEAEKQQALVSVASHSLYIEASAWPHCTIEAEVEPIEFVDRTRFPEADKKEIATALAGESTFILVSYMTSEQKPQPLTGGGKHYIFLIHPVSFEVIYSRTGTWRS
jgi:hypothetical protein